MRGTAALTPPDPTRLTLPSSRAQADVTYDDQQKINTFSRLNAKVHDLQARITVKKAAAEDLEEAGNEVMLLDDETVPFAVGECLVHLPREDAEARLQQREPRRRVGLPAHRLPGKSATPRGGALVKNTRINAVVR